VHVTAEAKLCAEALGTPTRVFLEKRLQTIENKGRALKKETKEAARIWKQKVGANYRRELFEVTQERVPQIGTSVKSKLVSAIV
jgi:hypothetical protein